MSANLIQCPYCGKEYPLGTESCVCGYAFRGSRRADDLICPKCQKIAPPGTDFCDCGYDFSKGSDTMAGRKKAIAISCVVAILSIILYMFINAFWKTLIR